ncbi:MAG: hypothetical protein HC783_14255, partial [Rhodobacteraceae bacterium]|nr:hypothetical protein [Paracoccaceae bacterium]
TGHAPLALKLVDPQPRRAPHANGPPRSRAVAAFTLAPHFDGTPGKAGARYPRFAGFAVETQRFPDSPNRPHFPSARLAPGQTYRHRMEFDFTPLDG